MKCNYCFLRGEDLESADGGNNTSIWRKRGQQGKLYNIRTVPEFAARGRINA